MKHLADYQIEVTFYAPTKGERSKRQLFEFTTADQHDTDWRNCTNPAMTLLQQLQVQLQIEVIVVISLGKSWLSWYQRIIV